MRHRRGLQVNIVVQFGRLEYFTILLVSAKSDLYTIFCWFGRKPGHFLLRPAPVTWTFLDILPAFRRVCPRPDRFFCLELQAKTR